MREILFRGKRKDNGAWETGSLVVTWRGLSDEGAFIADKITGYHTPIIPETVGQYTGLSDKNGKKIFEGDILLSRYEDKVEDSGYGSIYNEVAFTNGSFGMIGENTGDIIPFSEYPVTEEVVVGNIYDNPSLIQ